MDSYIGKILYVNLTDKTADTRELDAGTARLFLGGNGLAAKIIHDTVPPSADPLSPENVLVFATGPFNGTAVWGSGRGHLAGISPLTGIFADSNFGGDFAASIRPAGYDAIVIAGKSSEPVYLYINDGKAEIRPASHLSGEQTGKTHSIILSETAPDVQTAVIGPAGEKLVPYASIMCSGKRLSAAGRGGLGAVMGSKNIKGVALRGSKKVTTAFPDELKSLLKELLPSVREQAKGLTDIGTPILVNNINASGRLGTRNNQRETFAGHEAISGQTIAEKHRTKHIACRGCPVACGKMIKINEGEHRDLEVKMPEYETLFAIGSMLENNDLQSIFNANHICDELGIDTISFGVTVAFLTECVEKNLFSNDDLEIPLEFGQFSRLPEITRMAALREGRIGELLAMGSQRLAEEIGGNSKNFLYAVKGLEIAGHSARGVRTMGLAYATATRGGSHHDARANYRPPAEDPGFEGLPSYIIKSNHATALGDSLVMCRFLSERASGREIEEKLLKMINLVTGADYTLEELEKTGERIYNLERLINTQRGVTRNDDTLPWRVLHEPIPDGPLAGRAITEEDLNQMLDEYYRLRGWTVEGIPGKKKLKELDLI